MESFRAAGAQAIVCSPTHYTRGLRSGEREASERRGAPEPETRSGNQINTMVRTQLWSPSPSRPSRHRSPRTRKARSRSQPPTVPAADAELAETVRRAREGRALMGKLGSVLPHKSETLPTPLPKATTSNRHTDIGRFVGSPDGPSSDTHFSLRGFAGRR